MHNPYLHGVGGVLSADIAVPDHEKELRFYQQVLTTGPNPLWRDDLTNNRGTPVIGLGERSPEYEFLPLQWMPHFQVSDVAAGATTALKLGGRELMHAKGEDGQSEWAVLTDPVGAAFGLIPVVPGDSNHSEQPGRIGCISRLSLVAGNLSSVCEFYEQVVGWTTAKTGTEGCVEMKRPDGVTATEICPDTDEYKHIPSVWILSLPVGDFGESLRLVRENGGEIVKEEYINGSGYAIIQDPVGVYIALQATE